MTKRNIVHIEIPAANGIKAGEFYQKLFGWEIQHVPEMNYTMWEPHEGPGVGFSELGDPAQPNSVLIYVNSEDIAADLKQAASLGAKIIQEKLEIPQTGWFGIFQDPSGNHIALYTSMDSEFNK